MKGNDVHIEKYDWHLRVFYAVTCYHVGEIMLSLKDIDCPESIQNRVQENLMRCVMVIGLHSSHAEFLNSFEHELRHLVDDIAETFGLDMGGEQVAYLTGDLNSLLWKDIHEFICCCNCKT